MTSTRNSGKKHYSDIAARRRKSELVLIKFMTQGADLSPCAWKDQRQVENVRKIVGGTEPKSALPGTIAAISRISVLLTPILREKRSRIIHASGNVEEAKQEVALWFKAEELHNYKTAHEAHVF